MINRLLIFLCAVPQFTFAQQDPEFPKGAVFYFSAQQGINSRFDGGADHYIGGLSLAPAFTVIPSHVRLGLSSELVRTEKKIFGLAGPALSWKLKTFRMKPLGSLFNLQFQVEHLWGTGHRRLAGASLGIELFQFLNFRLMGHRDYHYDQWWLRAGTGINLLQKKRRSPTGTDPMRDN
jgi:hypothetical protein